MTQELTKTSDELQKNLERMKEDFALALPKHIPAERFVRVAQTAIANKPELLTLERASLFLALTQCAQEGLMPDGREAAIVPFKGKAKLMPMVAGICKKARNSGELSIIDAQVVYERDDYSAWTDEHGPHFKHTKAFLDRGNPVLTYAYAITKDGGVFFEEISEPQMLEIQKLSKAGADSPWNGPFKDEMRRKSALRRLGKYRLPNSSDLEGIFEKDDEFSDFKTENEAEPETKPVRLGKVVEAQASETAEAILRPKPSETKPEPAPKPESVPKPPDHESVVGKIADLKVKDGEGKSGPWRRFAFNVGGFFYGTFDKKIGEGLISVADDGLLVKINYKKRTDGSNIYRDIVSWESVSQEVPI